MMGIMLRGRVTTRTMIWRRQPKPQRPQQALQQHAPLPASGFDPGERERQRDRETERDRERQRETERDRERQRETERDRERQRETERQRDRQTETDRDRWRDKWREKDMERERRAEKVIVVCDGDGS
jgi:hypothetical protein